MAGLDPRGAGQWQGMGGLPSLPTGGSHVVCVGAPGVGSDWSEPVMITSMPLPE